MNKFVYKRVQLTVTLGLVIRWVRPKVHHLDTVLVHHLDDEIGLRNEKSNLEFVNALSDNLERRFFRAFARQVLSIHNGQTKVGGVPLRSVRDLLQRGHVIQKVEGSTSGSLFVVTTEQDIDLVGTLAQGCR
jgi:hypothetical protein